jgi:unsaturated chondroitin disaccharide hydrolase
VISRKASTRSSSGACHASKVIDLMKQAEAVGDNDLWTEAIAAMQGRAADTAATLQGGFPHWADPRTGSWTTTPDGDWTGGAFPGMLWLAHHATGDARLGELARDWCLRLRPRVRLRTAFKGFGFYYGAALGEMLAGDRQAGDLALEAASTLRGQFEPALGLIPLGRDAEEGAEVGEPFSSIDSLQATPLLFWAARRTGDATYADCAVRHTTRVLDIHHREDGSIIQSSELEADGSVRRRFTHKGATDTSVWGRAQAWGMLYATMAHARLQRPEFLHHAMRAADWWLGHVPASMIAFWDFDDPAIPNTECDTAATAIVCNALLKLAELAPTQPDRDRYRDAAVRTARVLVSTQLTPVAADDRRPAGMLVGGCFNKRADSRASDYVAEAELIFGSYYLLESLHILRGTIETLTI